MMICKEDILCTRWEDINFIITVAENMIAIGKSQLDKKE